MRNYFSFSFKENCCIKIFSAICFLLPASVAFSQDDSVRVLENIVITATRTEKDVSDVGRSISIITNKQIENSVYTNVTELLSNQEGIYIPGAGQNPGNTQSIFTRGANSNQTVIMIDGVRITDPSAVNNALDLSELSLANVDRIEIVRGSHSTIYGTGAIGGVVNIITKKNSGEGLNGFAEIKAGTFNDKFNFKNNNLLQENVFLNYSSKSGFYTNLNFVNLNVNGIDATANLPVADGAYNKQDSDDFSKLDAAGKIGFRNEKWDVFGAYKFTNQKNDIDAASFLDDDNATLKFHRDQYNYGIKYNLSDKINFQYSGGYSYMDRRTINDSSIIDFTGNYDKTYSNAFNKGYVFVNEIQSNLLIKGLTASLGLGHYNDYMSAQSYYYDNSFGPPAYISEANLDSLHLKSSIKHIFFYSDINGVLLGEKFKNLSVGIGSRLNNHNLFGNFMTYVINPSYKIDDNSLGYFSYSTGFNAPSLYQLYNPEFFAKGNLKLEPETSKTYELGFKQYHDNFNFQISAFNTIVKDLIQYVRLEDKTTLSTTGYTYINVSEQTNTGVEFKVESRVNKKLTLAGNFSAVNGKLVYSGSDIKSNQIGANEDVYLNGQKITSTEVVSIGLSRRPSYIANLSALYLAGKKVSFAVNMRMVSSRNDAYYDPALFSNVNITLENYSITDCQVNYLLNKQLLLSFRAENVFDKKYYEIAGYNTRGRSFYLKVKYSFGKK